MISFIQGQQLPTLQEIQRAMDLNYRDIAQGLNWKVAEGKWVSVHYVAGEIPTSIGLQRAVSLMDRAVTADCSTLNLSLPSKPIPVFIYPSDEELGKALGMSRNFGRGVSMGAWAVIVASKSRTYSDLASEVAHELGHAIVHERIGTYGCQFAAEGIANFLEAKFMHSKWLANPRPVEATPILTLLDKAQSETDFIQAARFFDYLILLDHNNPTRIKLLLAGLNQERVNQFRRMGETSWSARVQSVFQRVYSASPAQLERRWRTR